MKWTIEQALVNMNVPSEDWDIYKEMLYGATEYGA
jgi:hypothetical protein